MELDLKGRIHSVETFGAVDGPGIRFVVFMQGCPLRCVFCHNPDSWNPSGGSETTVGALLGKILQYRSFIEKGGVTLSGGEPLMQAEFTRALLRACRANGLHTAVDTSGCIPLSACREAVDEADLLLLDIKAADTVLARDITGTGLENALALLEHREKNGAPVWIRHVLVPGYTLWDEQAHRMGALLSGYKCVEKVELLPFHKLGEYKWRELALDYKLTDTPEPSAEQAEAFAAILRGYGLKA